MESSVTSEGEKCKMNDLIPVFNKIHEVFSVVGGEIMEVPQIVVVGYQSSGKSSVLESLVGRDFLPRGSGIVTRRPLVLQLIGVSQADLEQKRRQFPEMEPDCEDWALFEHLGDEIFFDFNLVREEIVAETERVTGTNKNISDVPIFLKIFSRNVITLTLIDLPGITKIPVGDQPEDIDIRIREMIIKFVKNPNSIILAITAANTDFATSEALQIAREYDPDGSRTLAVLTKLDIMDHGTDAYEALSGNVIKVKLGIIGVVNRCQLDINNNKAIKDSLADERTFFNTKYPLISHLHGSLYLARTLNRLLLNHIRQYLPVLRRRITEMLEQYHTRSQQLGSEVTDKVRYVNTSICSFASTYCSTVEGNSQFTRTSELVGGARICYIFHETFGRTLDQVNPLGGLKRHEILTAIRNSTGLRPALFVPEMSFVQLAKRQIKRLESPSIQCVHLVYDEMQRTLELCLPKDSAERFPKLHARMTEIVITMLNDRLSPTIQFVENLIASELAYINTRHPDFREATLLYRCLFKNIRNGYTTNASENWQENEHNNNENTLSFGLDRIALDESGGFNGLSDIFQEPEYNEESIADIDSLNEKTDCPKMTIREYRECIIIERLIVSYFKIVRKTIQDSVPKAIMNFLVNNVKDNIHSELMSKISSCAEDIESLLSEPEHVISKRNDILKMIGALKRANLIVSEIRETHVL